MHVLVRLDASQSIGSGHFFRCIALASSLHKYLGATITFVTSPLTATLRQELENRGFKHIELDTRICEVGEISNDQRNSPKLTAALFHDAQVVLEKIKTINNGVDLCVVDHYAIDSSWHSAIRSCCPRILVIDDLSDRSYDCDLLIDQGMHKPSHFARYQDLVPKHCQILTGPKYALIPEEFSKIAAACAPREEIKQVLIFLGGSSHASLIAEISKAALKNLPFDVKVTILTGVLTNEKTVIEDVVRDFANAEIKEFVSDMAGLLKDVDFAIGAGGSIIWQWCCLGVPSIICPIAANQLSSARMLGELGLALLVEEAGELRSGHIGQHLLSMLSNPLALKTMSANIMNLVDGLGVTRVVQKIKSLMN